MENRNTTDSAKDREEIRQIQTKLESLANMNRAAFMVRLMPGIEAERVLGLQKKEVAAIAARLSRQQKELILQTQTHRYYEEEMLHIELMNRIKDPEAARKALDGFAGQLRSWAHTDSMTFPKIKDQTVLEWAEAYRNRHDSYARRLAILWIMKRALRPAFSQAEKKVWLAKALAVSGSEKEITDAKGWLLCEALIKEPEIAWPYFLDRSVDLTVRRTAVQKSIESRRIDPGKKEELKVLRKRLGREESEKNKG